jgi:hypothetical protein
MLPHRLYEHPSLAHIDLVESYVLDWRHYDGVFELMLDAVLLPSHQLYRAPTPSEWGCFKRGRLVFTGVTGMVGADALDRSRPATDATGEQDFGHVEGASYTRLGDFRLTIEFAGSVSFSASDFRIEFEEASLP